MIDNAVLEQLDRLYRRDLGTRQQLLEQGKLYGTYDDAMQRVHVENAVALDRIIAQHGWPGIALVGLEGSRMAWTIAQHAIGTPKLQRGFLRLLKEAAEQGDATARQAAFLTDRVRFNEGRGQVYGTVLDCDENGILNCELDCPERVDQRRAAVGLPPIEQSLEKQRRAVAAEGGAPPADFAAYQAAARDWAKRVGWL